ncbi:MAG: hypothetical protein K2X80_06365 [Pseudomonadaceae bacterium]|nr:hypothetical protein [Pseudomonadaceae bacterium]
MSMPIERTLSIIATRRFLYDLSLTEDVPENLRLQATRLLRHYPSGVEVTNLGRREAKVAETFTWWSPMFAAEDKHDQAYLEELLQNDKLVRT